MCRFLYTATFSLLFLIACGSNNEAGKRSKRIEFPIIETPAIFTATFNDDNFLVFVESSSNYRIRGHYMSLNEERADSLPFQLDARKRNARLHYNGKRETFRPRINTIDKDHAEGIARLSLFGSATFEFNRFEEPEFQSYNQGRYQDTLFSVKETDGLEYAQGMGFWSELADETAVSDKIFKMGQAIAEVPLTLQLDVFEPQDDTLQKRPLVMLIHGGAFYFGSKDDKSITKWCRHLSSLGYVTASIDYRIGFLPSMSSIGRAGYRAVQDAHAAMRYLIAHQEDYGIDTSMIFVGGASAGSITALNLAFMNNENRPEYTHGGFLRPELGGIDTCGNEIRNHFRIKGIVDMWGAMPDTSMLRGHNIPILAFHGDADNIVPYGYDYPFGVAGMVNTLLSEKMYGSSHIIDCAIKLGHPAHLVTFGGYKHSPHIDPKTKELNDNFYTIQDMMSEFFYNIINPEEPKIISNGTYYSVEPCPVTTSWKAEGGVILDVKDNVAHVAWIGNAPKRNITVSGAMPRGIGFGTTKTIAK